MFFLSKIEPTLRLPPHLLNRPLDEAIKEQLDSIFLDKVIVKLGLCVSVIFGLLLMALRLTRFSVVFFTGSSFNKRQGNEVNFRLVMFRPFVGEVITARLKESTVDGLRCI